MWSKSTKFFESLMIIPAIATFYLFDSKVISIRATSGQSMDPTIKQDSVLIIDKIFYKIFNQGIKKGDIVVGNQPVNPKTYICKRVIETGGNTLPNHPSIKVPLGCYWLEGDNKQVSYDSRHHGCVPQHLIQGKVLFVIPI